MRQRDYPCMSLSISKGAFSLWFHLESGYFFEIQYSFDYDQIAQRGLECSHAIKVPFYNEVKL